MVHVTESKRKVVWLTGFEMLVPNAAPGLEWFSERYVLLVCLILAVAIFRFWQFANDKIPEKINYLLQK